MNKGEIMINQKKIESKIIDLREAIYLSENSLEAAHKHSYYERANTLVNELEMLLKQQWQRFGTAE